MQCFGIQSRLTKPYQQNYEDRHYHIAPNTVVRGVKNL